MADDLIEVRVTPPCLQRLLPTAMDISGTALAPRIARLMAPFVFNAEGYLGGPAATCKCRWQQAQQKKVQAQATDGAARRQIALLAWASLFVAPLRAVAVAERERRRYCKTSVG